MNAKRPIAIVFILTMSLMISSCGPGQLFAPTPTPTRTLTPIPTLTLTPTLTPAPTETSLPTSTTTEIPRSFTVIKSTIERDMLSVIVEDEGISFFAPVWIGISFLNDESYVIDETGARLDFVEGKSNETGQVVLVFAGASASHKYQLIQPNKPPIDLFPELVTSLLNIWSLVAIGK